MSKDLIVEVRIKWDDLMNKDELGLLSLFTEKSENAIKRKIVDGLANKALETLPNIDIDLADIKERVKQGIVDRKIDEVLGNE